MQVFCVHAVKSVEDAIPPHAEIADRVFDHLLRLRDDGSQVQRPPLDPAQHLEEQAVRFRIAMRDDLSGEAALHIEYKRYAREFVERERDPAAIPAVAVQHIRLEAAYLPPRQEKQ